MPHRLRLFVAVVLLTAGLFACSTPPENTATGEPQRLIDLFPDAAVDGTPPTTEVDERAVWRFADGNDTWKVGAGAKDLHVEDETLRGRSNTDFPLLYTANPLFEEAADLIHAVEVRARVSAGENLSVSFSRDEDLDPQKTIGQAKVFPWSTKSPLLAGEEMQTYTIVVPNAVQAHETRYILLRPSDAVDAEFEIESIRVIPRAEHLASIDSGIGWHGMGEIYRESLVSRAPETLRFRLDLPARARLDLALGTLDNRPVTFEIHISPADAADPLSMGKRLTRRTVTRADHWSELFLSLEDFAGQSVDLALMLHADEPGTLGFWGSPVVRALNAEGTTSEPNVLMIVADTLRADHLDAYGHDRETAPHLTRLAEQGALFEDCVTQATWTKVSFPSFMTGLYPTTHGVRSMPDRLPASAVTLAESFREAGYATLGISAIGFHGRFTNLHQGYEVFHESGSHDGYHDESKDYVDRLIPWLDRHQDIPFFAVLHVSDPHSPFEPLAPYDRLWTEADGAQFFEESKEKVKPKIKDPLMKRFVMPTTDELAEAEVDVDAFVAHEKGWYDGSIRAMDVEVGRVIEHLEGLNLLEETVIVFLSDHGEGFLEHDKHWHGNSVYGELGQVPLVLRGPGVPAGLRIDSTVESVDVLPTLLELAGIALPEGVQGHSLKPLLDGGSWRPQPAFMLKGTFGDDMSAEEPVQFAIVTEEWKLVENRHPDWDAPTRELYDHRTDKLDQNDVAAEHPEVVEKLAEQLEAWKESTEAAKLEDEVSLDGMNAEELERLRSLGYVQ